MTTAEPGRGRSKRRWAAYAVVALFGINAIGSAVEPAADAGPAPTDVSVVESPALSTPGPTAAQTASAVPSAAPTPSLTFGPSGPTESATVSRVVDGDTIRVVIDGQDVPLRYIGVDTPEPDANDSTEKAMADAATAANASLVEGREVLLERDVSETDPFGRLLRYVWLETATGWILVNERLVQLGVAEASSYPPDVAFDGLFRIAQSEARAEAIGMWAPVPTPSPSPTALPTPSPFTSSESTTVRVGQRTRFEGQMGSYTWMAMRFPDDQMTVRWSVSASSKGDCQVGWHLAGDSGATVSGKIPVNAGESETGSVRRSTPFGHARMVVRSTCGVWKLSMEGYEPPPTPKPVVGGGGGGSNCHPSYEGACLKRNAGDYDCRGGSGNGPNYTGFVYVVGPDEFDLDRDGDGLGCESS